MSLGAGLETFAEVDAVVLVVRFSFLVVVTEEGLSGSDWSPRSKTLKVRGR